MRSAIGQEPVTSDAELLATLIQHGYGRSAAHDLAHNLLTRFGGLRQLLHADTDALMAEQGIGVSRSQIIRALPELARRYYAASLPVGEAIRSPADTEAYLQAKIRHLGHELFCCHGRRIHVILQIDLVPEARCVPKDRPNGKPGKAIH